jgi:hypothetical protein
MKKTIGENISSFLNGLIFCLKKPKNKVKIRYFNDVFKFHDSSLKLVKSEGFFIIYEAGYIFANCFLQNEPLKVNFE